MYMLVLVFHFVCFIEYISWWNRHKCGDDSLDDDGLDEGAQDHGEIATRNWGEQRGSGWRWSPSTSISKSSHERHIQIALSNSIAHAKRNNGKCTLKGYEIQPKTVVYVNAWAVGRDPEYWENPDEFVPKRFLNSSIDLKGPDFGFIPFGSGQRMCPGTYMGLVSMEIAVAILLYAFDWKMPHGIQAEDIDEDSHPGITMHKKNLLLLVPKTYHFD